MGWWTKYTNEQVETAIANGLGGSAASLIHRATVTLADSDIKPLQGATPFALAGTPGANRMIQYQSGFACAHIVTPYNNVSQVTEDGDVCGIRWAVSDEEVSVHVTNWELFDNAVGDMVAPLPPYSYALVDDNGANLTPGHKFNAHVDADAWGINEGLEFFVAVSGAPVNFAGGSASNTLQLGFIFFVVDIVAGQYLTTTQSGWNETTRMFV